MGIKLAYGRCECLLPYEKHLILESLQESIEKKEKDMIGINEESERYQQIRQDKGELETVKARVGFTPECKSI